MSTKYVYICDHCGAECSDRFEFLLFGKWARKDAQYIPDNVHGCTREHTIFAVAKILGIGIDGKATESLAAKDEEIERLQGLVGSANFEQYHNLERQKKRLLEYETLIEELRGKVASDHVHEPGSCTHCDTQNITDPSKPTKPLTTPIPNQKAECPPIADPKEPTRLTACVSCGGTGVDLNQHCCFECSGKGYL